MLHIQVLMNTSLEEVFNFKCISAQDQNLEIRLRNDGDEILTVPSYCDLESDDGTVRINYLYPHGPQTIVPGDSVAFYCFMEEDRWPAFKRIIFYDSEGRKYIKSLHSR